MQSWIAGIRTSPCSFRIYNIDVVRTGLHHIAERAEQFAVLGVHLHSLQVCDIVLVLFQRNGILSRHIEAAAFIPFDIVDVVNSFEFLQWQAV